MDEAKKALALEIAENYTGARALDGAEIYEVNLVFKFDLSKLYARMADDESAQCVTIKEQEEYDEFQRLNAKYGNLTQY